MAECPKYRLRMVLHNKKDSCLYREFDGLKAARRCFDVMCRQMESDYQGRLMSTQIFLQRSELYPEQMERVWRCLYVILAQTEFTALVELVEPAARCLVSMEISPK